MTTKAAAAKDDPCADAQDVIGRSGTYTDRLFSVQDDTGPPSLRSRSGESVMNRPVGATQTRRPGKRENR